MFTIEINGKTYHTSEDLNLLDFLRDQLHVTSVKNGCSEGACGACMVLADGKAVRACLLTAAAVSGKRVVTVEGLPEREREAYAAAFTQAGAVQCGFCTPGMIVSAKALLDRNPHPSSLEIKEAIRGNICRCTGYVKIEKAIGLAATILRGEGKIEAAAFPGVGSSLARVDGREKVLGTAQYVDDLFVRDMLYGAVLRTRYPRALIKSIDASEARNRAGVEAVLTSEDVPGERYWGFLIKDWPVLVAAGEETRYIGDALALVAARSKETAREALALIKVDYEELPPVVDTAFAVTEGAPKIHPKGNLLSTTRIKRGNAGEALARSAHVVTNRYRTPPTEHAFMEPESALAVPDGENGVTVYVGSQSVYEDRKGIMSILGLPAEKVRVISKRVGGAFGGKEDLSVQHHAALLAFKTERPVKLTLSRQESILVHPKRHAMDLELTTGCDADGRITAVMARIVADTGAYASLGPPVVQRACTHIGGPYRVSNADIEGFSVYTNNPPAGPFRGFGVPQACFACESNIDLLAEKVGISPWEIRNRNALEPGMTMASGQIAGPDTAMKETLLAVKEIYDRNGSAGIACAIKNTGLGSGVPDTGVVKIKVESGRAVVLTGAACVGQGLATILTQLVSETTGLGAEAIEVASPDTSITPDSGTTTASRQTLFTGEAARRAALQLAEEMKRFSLSQLEGKEYAGEYTAMTDPAESEKPEPVIHVAYSYATQVVLLDDEGKVKRVVSAHDLGKSINPRAAEGQIEGGIAMGLGYALKEDFPLRNGVPTARFGTLGLLRSTDMPDMEVILVGKEGSPLAYGAKGVGEIAAVLTAPAVASAYHHRDGKIRSRLPLTDTPYERKPS